MAIQAGKLRNLGVIQRPIYRTTDTGESLIDHWEDVLPIWFGISTSKVEERVRAGKVDLVRTHQITTHYNTNTYSNYRIRLGTRIFQISGVIDVDNRHAELQITADEISQG